MALTVLLNLRLVNGRLVANIFGVASRFAESDLKHSHNASELKVVKSFFEWLIFVNNGDVANLVELMETFDAVLDQLSEFNRAFDGV